MNRTFIATSYLLALVLASDAHHQQAIARQRSISGLLVSSEYVLVEFFDAMVTGTLREVAAGTLALLRQSPGVEIVPASTALMNAGISMFQSRRDKLWGLTDCTSFIIMHEHGITDALTSDHHFEQAGFRALLRQTSTA